MCSRSSFPARCPSPFSNASIIRQCAFCALMRSNLASCGELLLDARSEGERIPCSEDGYESDYSATIWPMKADVMVSVGSDIFLTRCKSGWRLPHFHEGSQQIP